MQLDFFCWQLTFHVWSPVWSPQFQVIINLYLFMFSFPKIHDEMNKDYTDNVISYHFHVQSHLNRLYYNNYFNYCEISYQHV